MNTTKCKIEGCSGIGKKGKGGRRVFMNDYCYFHYERNRIYGEPNALTLKERYRSEYISFQAMNSRCRYVKNIEYKNYGGKGISICERWMGYDSFKNFIKDMGEKPDKSYTIDRIDRNGNYEPSNCKWSTKIEQSNNCRDNVFIEFNGEKLTIPRWSERLGLDKNTLYARYREGWSIERLFSPIKKKLTEIQKKEIICLKADGMKPNDISKKFNISCATVYNTIAQNNQQLNYNN